MIVKESISRDIMRLVIWYPIRWLIELLPIMAGYRFLRLLGRTHYMMSRGRRMLIKKNLESAFNGRLGGAELDAAVRKYFENHYVNQLQIFEFPRLTRDNVERLHTFEGLEHLEEALKEKRGCILVHPHFGPAQLPLCALGVLGYNVVQMGLPSDEGLSYIGKNVAFRLRVKYESMIPAKILPVDKFLRPVFDALKKNAVVMTTGDGAGGGKLIGKFIYVDFMGKPTRFPVGPYSLAAKTGSPVLPMFATLRPDGGYKAVIYPPIDTQGTEEEKVRAFVSLFERHVAKQPFHWHFWDELQERRLPAQERPAGAELARQG